MNWEFGVCQTCRNFGRESRMEKIKINVEKKEIEVWVCPICGEMRRL